MHYSEPITSNPELFAMLVENREAVMLLAPFIGGSYDVAVEIQTSVDQQKYFRCRIARVFPKLATERWEVQGLGGTILEAVYDALKQANQFTEKYGI